MAENKKSFLLYCDLIHTVSKMPKDKAGELFIHILEYVNDKNPVTDDLIIQLTFEPIKQSLKRDLQKYETIRNRNSENAKLRWDKKNATASDRIPNRTKNADSVNDSVSEINNNNKADADDEINYLDVHQSFADRLLLNDLECQSIFEVSEKRVTFELLNTFIAHLTNQSKVYNHYSEFKKHFSNWMRKHEPSKENKSKVDAYLENNLAAKKLLGI